jgi:protein-L-isoaspartate(D-aspartate) O-methyltransferase
VPATPPAAPQAAAAGVGLDSAAVRARLVERMRASGVTSVAVLEAMAAVPRHAFVDSALIKQAYEDTSLPIGHGQTISKPSVVARMLALLVERPGGGGARMRRVLEIGTGCGYQAALLARLAAGVVSVERVAPLHRRARVHLDAVGTANVRLVLGDGRHGHAPLAPYDAIVAAAGGDELPAAWLEQLAVGGRLVAPVRGDAGQTLVVVDRTAHGWERRFHDAVEFVPLKSGVE